MAATPVHCCHCHPSYSGTTQRDSGFGSEPSLVRGSIEGYAFASWTGRWLQVLLACCRSRWCGLRSRHWHTGRSADDPSDYAKDDQCGQHVPSLSSEEFPVLDPGGFELLSRHGLDRLRVNGGGHRGRRDVDYDHLLRPPFRVVPEHCLNSRCEGPGLRASGEPEPPLRPLVSAERGDPQPSSTP